MIKKFGLMLVATMSFVALSISQANASLNITINKVTATTATVSFQGSTGTISGTLNSDFAVIFPIALTGNLATSAFTASPGPAQIGGLPIAPGGGLTTSNITSLTLANGVLGFDGSANLQTIYFASGSYNLTGSNIWQIANGNYFSNTIYNGTFSPVNGVIGGGVNLTVTGVSAVPEPASMVYGSLVAGSMGLSYWRRRRAAK